MPHLLRCALIAIITLPLVLILTPAAQADTETDRQVRDQVALLLAQMTLAEKIGQLNLVSQGEPVDGQLEAVRAGKIGSMMNVVDPAMVARYQTAAKDSRLKIPLLFGLDAVDVFRISFPPPLAWAATFNPELAQSAARAVAGETAAVGINWTFAPMVDITRDPRWGRVVEGAGEDPYLGSVFAAARTRGYLEGGLMPTAKHYIAYGAGEAGRDYNGALVPNSDLYDRYLPPFRASLAAGAQTVMASLNTVNGVPATANRFLLEHVLRRDLDFRGFVTSDYNAIGELKNHGVAGDLAAASRLALKAGIDLDMEGDGYSQHLPAELASGRITLADIDIAVVRVLTVKANMGLFGPKAARLAPSEAETRATARQVARESFVLLKNEHATLPIPTGTRTIALIGAAAKADVDDSWYGPANQTRPTSQTLFDALTERLVPGQTLLYAPAFTDPCGKTLADGAAAAETAGKADLIVFIVGEDCEFSGEGASRANLDLSAAQLTMLDKLVATGRPIALIVTSGRPLTLTNVDAKVAAIIFAWLPRNEGRTALAEVLTGSVSPSGRLPMSLPRSVGQIPISYDVLPTSRPPGENRYTSRYLDEEVTPLYPFGHGLSYTTFSYQNLRTTAATMARDGSVWVDVDVTNTGSRTGQEVAQLYIRRPVASRSRPLRELKGFNKVTLKPGQTQTIRFELSGASLAFHDDAGAPVLEPGLVQLFTGGSSATATLTTSLTLQ
jgi:beta-glucosidase